MEILLNDLSIVGQYSSVDDFIDNLAREILPILNKSRGLGFTFLSKTTSYSLNITKDLTLHDLLTNKHRSILYPEVSLFMSAIADMMSDPFWDNDIRTDNNSSYELSNECEVPNCITEAFERSGILVSLWHDDFQCKFIPLHKDGEQQQVRNSASAPIFSEHLVLSKDISLVEFLRVCLRDEKVLFCERRRGDYYVDEPCRNSELGYTDIITIRDDLLIMLSSVASGETSRFSKSITYKKKKYFEFRTTISDDREFRIFYIQGDEGAIFLYPLIKKTEQIPDSVLRTIEEIAKRYR